MITKVRPYASRQGKGSRRARRRHIDAGIGTICEIAKGWNPKEGTPTAYLRKGLESPSLSGSCHGAATWGRVRTGESRRCIEAREGSEIGAVEALDSGVRIAVENHAATCRRVK